MQERRRHLSTACVSQRKERSDQKRYEAEDQRMSQSLKKESFLVDHKRRLLYCWNHKVNNNNNNNNNLLQHSLSDFQVASSFWMWIFTKLGTGKGPEVVDNQPGQVQEMFQNVLVLTLSPAHIRSYSCPFTYEEIQVYKITWQMAPRSDEELLAAAKEYTSILLVRWSSLQLVPTPISVR